MSVSASPDNSGISQLVDALSQLVESARFENAVSALIAYEYVITIDQEVVLFWNRKKTGASWLFFAIRYLALLTYAILGPASFAPLSDDSCQRVQLGVFLAQTIQYPFWAAFAGLRALALTGMNKWLAAVIFISSCGPFVLNAWTVSLGFGSGNAPLVGCDGGPIYEPTRTVAVLSTAITRSFNVIADLIVIAVTWRYALKTDGMRSVLGTIPPLARVLVVNGAIYFFVIVILNLVQLTLSIVPYYRTLPHADIILFTDPLTAMICRFMLALQAANQRAIAARAFDDTSAPLDGEDDIAQVGGSLRFASVVIGSVGASIPMVDPDASLFQSDDEHEECVGAAEREPVASSSGTRQEEGCHGVMSLAGS